MEQKKSKPFLDRNAAGILMAMFCFVMGYLFYNEATKKVSTTEERIQRLTASLSESVYLLTDIQKEIEARSALASKLQKDVDTYDQLVKLKQPEVEAVAQLLRGEFQQERRHALYQDSFLHSSFFLLGIFADRLFERFRRRRERQQIAT